MEHDDLRRGDQVSNGRVLAIAGGASAIAAAAVAGASRVRARRSPPSNIERVRASIRDAGRRPVQTAGNEVERLSTRAKAEADKRARRASKLATNALASHEYDGRRARAAAANAKEAAAARLHQSQALTRAEAGEAAKAFRQQWESARERGRDLRGDLPHLDAKQVQEQREALADMASRSYRSARGKALPAVESARERAPELANAIASKAGSRVNQVAEYAAELADTARHRAERIDGSSIASSVKPAGESVRETFSRLKDDVTPVARDAAVQAAAAAIHLWEATREQTSDLNTKDLQRASNHLFAELAGRAKEASAAVADTASTVTHEATEEIADKTEEARERAEDLTRRAASATADTSKDATSLLVWAGLAGGLVYYGLLTESQRRHVDSTARSVYNGVSELIRDIQGYDADF